MLIRDSNQHCMRALHSVACVYVVMLKACILHAVCTLVESRRRPCNTIEVAGAVEPEHDLPWVDAQSASVCMLPSAAPSPEDVLGRCVLFIKHGPCQCDGNSRLQQQVPLVTVHTGDKP
jgi:hypothetical protein